MTIVHLCTSKTTNETAYTSHQTVTPSDNWSSRETPVSLNFVPTKTKSKISVTYVSTNRRWLQRMAQKVTPQTVTLWWTLLIYLTRELCILPPCFTEASQIPCTVLLTFSVHSEGKNNNNFKSNSNKQINSITQYLALLLWRFLRPKFSTSQRGQSAKLRCQTFSHSPHV